MTEVERLLTYLNLLNKIPQVVQIPHQLAKEMLPKQLPLSQGTMMIFPQLYFHLLLPLLSLIASL